MGENIKTILKKAEKRYVELLNDKIDFNLKILTKWLNAISELEQDTKYIERLIKKSRKRFKKDMISWKEIN
ncbi:MAG: hypothetical protein ACFFDX_16385 [Candidatus Odinarchaeota archaeon]